MNRIRHWLYRGVFGLNNPLVVAQDEYIEALESQLETACELADEYLRQLKLSNAANRRKRAELRLQQELYESLEGV